VSSFISAFKPILIAVAVIVGLEAAVVAVRRPNDVERSDFLTFSYLRSETHRLIVYEKLRAFGWSSPYVIQLGDSSGFYGVNSDLVTSHLGGLRYINLSCCANMDFDGYYAVADFMLKRNPSIKAVVLYIGPFNFINAHVDNSFAEPIQKSFYSLRSYVMPPSLALRQEVLKAVYGASRISSANPELERKLEFLRHHDGWLPEDDIRMSGKARDDYWRAQCGPEHVLVWNDTDDNYARDLAGGREWRRFDDIARLAALTAGYNAKLILMAQPLPCRFRGTAFAARMRDLDRLRSAHPNLVVAPADVFFALPTEMFSSFPHLRVGNEITNSQRVALAVAQALGRSVKQSGGAGAGSDSTFPIADRNTPLTWSDDRFNEPAWKTDGTRIVRSGEEDRITEVKSFGRHRIETQVDRIEPNAPYIVSALVKPDPNRVVWLEVADSTQPGSYGAAFFDVDAQTSVRFGDTIDIDIETLPEGWFRCWLSMRFRGPSITMNVMMATKSALDYAGDGTSSIAIRKAALRPGARLSADKD
jgi:hypothetical protein